MLGRWQSGRKIDIAKKLLSNITDSLKDVENLELALRVYGHQRSYPPQDCNDTKLEINFLPSSIFADRIKGKLSMIKAKGTTPIAKSLEKAASDFPLDDARNIIILITDGKEECGMDPCAVSRLFTKKGIILKPFVIGIGLDKSWKENLDCVGTFFDASNERDFSNILNIVISHVVDNTTSQVNLLDSLGEPTETNISLTFYDNFTDIVKYNSLGICANPSEITGISDVFKKCIEMSKNERESFVINNDDLLETVFNKNKIIDDLLYLLLGKK
jgi:Ca-activated chloride channel family protein